MQAQRTWDGVAYIYEAHSHSRERLEWLKRDIPDAEIRWEPVGLIIPSGPLAGKSSGPCYVLWRPLPGVAAPELEDLADLLGSQAPQQPVRPISRPPPPPPRTPIRPAQLFAADNELDEDDNIGNRRLPSDSLGNQRYATERNGNQRYATERNGNQRHPAERNGNQRYATERNGNQRHPTERNGNQRHPAERNGNQRGMASGQGAFTARAIDPAASRRLTDDERRPGGERAPGTSERRGADRYQPAIDRRKPAAPSHPAASEAGPPAPARNAPPGAANKPASPHRKTPPSVTQTPGASDINAFVATPGAPATLDRPTPEPVAPTVTTPAPTNPPAEQETAAHPGGAARRAVRPRRVATRTAPPPQAGSIDTPVNAALSQQLAAPIAQRSDAPIDQHPEPSIAQRSDAPIDQHPEPSIAQRAAGSAPEAPEDPGKPLRGGPMRKLPKTTPYKGITRIDHPKKNMFGFYVRVGWNHQHRSKFFSDKTYGDRDNAMAAALTWRNQTEEELGKPHTELQVVGSSRTPTGVIGVRLHYDKSTPYYEASWRDSEGRTLRTRYSILKHGEQRAFELAVSARERGEQARLHQQAGTLSEQPTRKTRRRSES